MAHSAALERKHLTAGKKLLGKVCCHPIIGSTVDNRRVAENQRMVELLVDHDASHQQRRAGSSTNILCARVLAAVDPGVTARTMNDETVQQAYAVMRRCYLERIEVS